MNENKFINDNTKLHDFLSLELLVPNCDKCDCNRMYMFSAHASQCKDLKNPESPMVLTNFENQFGAYSDLGFYDAGEDFEIIGKVIKNENVYYLIIHKLESDQYDYIERRNEFWLTEKYGFKFDNNKIDNLKEGEIVNKGTRIIKNNNYDDNNNFRYGVNLKAIFYTEKLKTLEDAIIISKDAAEKLTSYDVEKISIVVNNNDLLLNLNQDPDGEYKCFPYINEEIENFLCVRRRINLSKIYSFDDLSLNSLRPDDEKFYSHGIISDLDIYSNLSDSDLDGEYNQQIRSLLNKRKAFNKSFLKLTDDIVNNQTEKCSSQLIQMYNRIKMEEDKIPFTFESSIFNGIVLQFTIIRENKLSVGSKISGR